MVASSSLITGHLGVDSSSEALSVGELGEGLVAKRRGLWQASQRKLGEPEGTNRKRLAAKRPGWVAEAAGQDKGECLQVGQAALCGSSRGRPELVMKS